MFVPELPESHAVHCYRWASQQPGRCGCMLRTRIWETCPADGLASPLVETPARLVVMLSE